MLSSIEGHLLYSFPCKWFYMYIILDYKEVEIEFADEINRANIESRVRATLSEDMQNTRICGLIT